MLFGRVADSCRDAMMQASWAMTAVGVLVVTGLGGYLG